MPGYAYFAIESSGSTKEERNYIGWRDRDTVHYLSHSARVCRKSVVPVEVYVRISRRRTSMVDTVGRHASVCDTFATVSTAIVRDHWKGNDVCHDPSDHHRRVWHYDADAAFRDQRGVRRVCHISRRVMSTLAKRSRSVHNPLDDLRVNRSNRKASDRVFTSSCQHTKYFLTSGANV